MHFKVQEAPREHWAWLIERLDLYITGAFTAIEAIDSAGTVRGMIGYDRWSGGQGSVEMHCAVEHPAAWLALVGPGLQYPFEQAYGKGVGLVYATVRDNNEPIKKFLYRLGWTMTHRLREGWGPNIDLLIFEMRRKDWYALRESNRTGRLLRAHEGRFERRVA